MKILHIINSMDMGGAQSLLTNIALFQKQIGHDVSILQLVKPDNDVLTDIVKKENINITYLSKGSVYNPFLIFKLMPYLENADVVHVHLFPAQYWTGFAKLLSLSKTPLITTEHSTQNKRRKHLILKYVDRFVYKKCYKNVIACADKAKETFIRSYPSVRCDSIPNGVNVALYASSKPYTKKELLGLSEDVFCFGMVARFAYPKRQDTLVRTLPLLPEKFHVVMVGGGDYENVSTLAEDLKVSHRVHFLGVRSDVPRILSTLDAVVMSSEYEGLSLSSIEGMAVGKPFIATNVNGLKEVVEGAGMLFECGDEIALAKIIEKLYNDKDFYQNIAYSCYQRAQQFDISVMVDQYDSVYKKCLK